MRSHLPVLLLVRAKPWYCSKTLWLSISGVVAGMGSLRLPSPWGSLLAVAVSAAGAYLRTQTAGPIAGTLGEKQGEIL